MKAEAPLRGLTQEEMLWRLWARAPQGAAHIVTLSWLNDLSKDGLAPSAIRVGNEGKHPRYRYDRKAYRRARQLLRFYRNGVTGRDDLTVLLFINSYSLEPALVREAIARVFRKSGVRLLNRVRSGYLGTDRNIGSSHAASILNKIGPIDQLMAEAGVSLSPEQLVEATRKMMAAEVVASDLKIEEPNSRPPGQLRSDLIATAFDAISGFFLLSDEKSGSNSDGGSEGAIRSATDQQLLRARDFVTKSPLAKGALAFLGNDPDTNEEIFARQFNSLIRNNAELAVMLLVVDLRESNPRDGSYRLI